MSIKSAFCIPKYLAHYLAQSMTPINIDSDHLLCRLWGDILTTLLLCDNCCQIHRNWQPRSIPILSHLISHGSRKRTQSPANIADFHQPCNAWRVGLSASRREWITIPLDSCGVCIPLAIDWLRYGHTMEFWPVRWQSKPYGRREVSEKDFPQC